MYIKEKPSRALSIYAERVAEVCSGLTIALEYVPFDEESRV